MTTGSVVRVPVPFSGGRSGVGPLTHGQANTLNWVGRAEDDASAIISWTFTLPGDATLADVTETLSVLVRRHEALRTTFDIDAEPPTQHVHAEGELLVDVTYNAETTADELVMALRARGIDFRADWPLRVAVAVDGDVVRTAVAIYSHMAVDFGSVSLVGGQFTELLADPALRVVGEPGHQPLDQADVESSERGKRAADAALRYWENHLRTAPQALYPMPMPARPREAMRLAHLRSPLAGRALAHIVGKAFAAPPAVVLAAMCAVLAQRTGLRRCVFASVSGNRFRTRLREYVGSLAQDGLLALDADVPTFDLLVRRAATATLSANNNSVFDARKLWRIIDQVCHDRGTMFTRDFALNDLSGHLGMTAEMTPPDPMPEGDELAAELARTEFPWYDSPEFPAVMIAGPAQFAPELLLIVAVNMRYVDEDDMALLLRGVERLLIAAATTPDLPMDRIGEVTGVPPVVRGPDWTLVDGCWVRLSQVADLMREATGTPAVHVAMRDGRLVAYLAATEEIRQPVAAHAACMSLLREPVRYTAMAPQWYVLCDGSPSGGDDVGAWQVMPVVAEGDGRVANAVH